jgi:hypothetical protein
MSHQISSTSNNSNTRSPQALAHVTPDPRLRPGISECAGTLTYSIVCDVLSDFGRERAHAKPAGGEGLVTRFPIVKSRKREVEEVHGGENVVRGNLERLAASALRWGRSR